MPFEGLIDPHVEHELLQTLRHPAGQQVWLSLGCRPSVSWRELDHALYRYYTGVTQCYDRPLVDTDLQYIRSQVENLGGLPAGNPDVPLSAFARFWFWFEEAVRCARATARLWGNPRQILIHGFLSRSRAVQLLQDQPVGTFLVRFSDSQPGKFGVAYVDRGVEHVLVTVSPKHGFGIQVSDGERWYQTLDELILKCHKFVVLYPNVRKLMAFTASAGEDEPC
eukprot:TRINITY_DN7732_c0_g1_i1.p1 TRINITY_DN7732_c0_g1~~TRINITY_DN7732_c0_g1_i1.p1  ORF type:complete len:223 (+),score=38.88 TRINITY_DN7732_c0_g1_i1:157-825(+)